MAKPGSRFPGLLVVAAETVCAELILMRLLMAGSTLTAQTQEGLVEIFQLNLRTGCPCYLSGVMTILTFLLAMLACQCKASLGRVIETFPVQRDKRDFGAAMLNMAASAIRFACGTVVGARVIPRARIHSALDLGMTLEALEAARSKIVAGGALGNSR